MVALRRGAIYSVRVVPDTTYREKLWDHAAGYAIVTEAGGRMTDIHGKPIDWTQRHAYEPTTAACWSPTASCTMPYWTPSPSGV